MQIDVLVFDGFDELDALGPYEVLANAFGADVRLVTLAQQDQVTGSHGVTVVPHGTLAEHSDLVVVPGGGWNDRAPRGTYAEAQAGALPRRLAELHARGTTIAAVCTGAMLLADLLEGRPAVTHHGALDELEARGALVQRDARVVDDGDLLTAGGVTSGIDLALHLVERFKDPETAALVAREMEHAKSARPTVVSGQRP